MISMLLILISQSCPGNTNPCTSATLLGFCFLRSIICWRRRTCARLVEEAQGLQRLDGGVEPPVGRRRPRRGWRQWLHELAVGAGGGGLAEHDEEVAVGARHGHHVVAPGAHGGPLGRLGGVLVGGGGRGDVEVQVHALLPRPDPALPQRLPVEVIHPPRLHAQKERKIHNRTKLASRGIRVHNDEAIMAAPSIHSSFILFGP
ncbi:hypothetical protein C2845_PM05G07980 [Panicum miliaceum]|uniref:Uncharacterized protein n=1 Tax=Panicum miliaceum TaxID=4540 RepID=A0A3L6SZ10_PANMI|nr:hypothetical protein C2845_PM05G07980 [Panicum miliaceum]